MTRAPWTRPGGTIGVLLGLGLLALGVLSLRLTTLPPLSYALDDPAIQPAGFYPPETGDGARFRWSRPSAGVLLPALAARQVYTVELATYRPTGVPLPTGLTLAAGGITTRLAPTAAWGAYTLTAPSQIGLQNAVALVATTPDDSFYPGQTDRRQLTAAVRRVAVALAPGLLGVVWPAPVLALAVALLPALAFAVFRRPRWRLLAAVLAVGLIGVLAWALLPGVVPGTLTAIVAGLVLLALGRWLWDQEAAQTQIATQIDRLRDGPGEWIGLIAGFAALAVAATWPLVTRLGDALPGWPADNFAFLYKIWWVRTALTTGANLFNDPHVFYPFGFNFGRGEPTLPNTVPAALLALLWGDAAGYNLVLLAGFILTGLGTYGLARTVGCARPAALLAGVVFMLAPYRLGQAAGHLQIAATAPLPFTLLFVERALQGKRSAAPWAGLCFGLTALTAWYYALIGGTVLVGYVILRAWQIRRSGEKPPLSRRATACAALLFALVAGVVLLPGLLPALGAAGEAPLTYSAKAADENSASLSDYLIPSQLQPLWGAAAMQAHAQQNIIEDSLYLGIPALLLAAYALWRPARPAARSAWIWAVLAALCLVLSLGLTLRVLPSVPVAIGGAPVPLPGRLLYDWVPGFHSIRAYARFGGAVALAVAVLAGLGATRLLARCIPQGRRVLPVLLLGLVLLDFWSAPYSWGLTVVAPDAVAAWLAAQPGGGAVMRLPLTTAIAGPPLYAGTAYGRPLAYGYETFEPPGFSAARPVLAGFPSPAAFAQLRAWRVRYVVVAASSYGADWPATRAYFATLSDWTPVYRAAQPVTYQAPLWVADIRTELLPALAPDELIVYQLK